MTGLFGMLGTATRGMNANQTALQTSGHNIANTNTDGYSRQRVHMTTERPYYMSGVGAIGMGVSASSVDRIVDPFIRNQTRDAYSKYRMHEQKSDALGQLEHFMNEPSETGIINQLSVMYDAWSKLGSNPELVTSKSLVIENSASFADMVREMAGQISQLKGEVTSNIEKGAMDFNEKLEQLSILNDQIFSISSNGNVPNDLLDTRDSLLKDIAGLADISATFDSYGRVSELKIGGKNGESILDINGYKKISVVSSENTISVGGDATNKTTFTSSLPIGRIVIEGYTPAEPAFKAIDVNEGEIGGFQAANKDIEVRFTELNTFVEKFAEKVNNAYSAKTGGVNFFDIGDPTKAKAIENIKVNPDLVKNPADLQSGEEPASSADFLPGDGSLAKAIEKLFSTKDMEPNGDQMTFAERYNNIVTKNGISKQQADNIAASQLTVLNQLEYKNESISGVNLNEEVSDVIRFSQAFQANARVIQTISDMLDTLINRTGA